MKITRKIGSRVVPIKPQKAQKAARVCASPACGTRFIPKRSDQIYCSKACNTREQQRKLRARARIGA